MNKILIDLTTARQVLEALNSFPHRHLTPFISDARTALREALAQPQQEPVGRVCFEGDEVVWTDEPPESGTLLYTSPPAQKFVCSTGMCHYRKPLTDEEIEEMTNDFEEGYSLYRSFARAVEAAHGIKENT